MARSVGYVSLTPRRPGLHSEDVTSRRIVFLIFGGLQPLDLVGPHEVFSHAGVLSPDAGYVCQVAARAAGPVRAASGLLVHAGRWSDGWPKRAQLAAEFPIRAARIEFDDFFREWKVRQDMYGP
jgi:transcriptional regulator GlxA family with amidase domain